MACGKLIFRLPTRKDRGVIMRRTTKSLKELMIENVNEINNDKQAIVQIEKRIEKRNDSKSQD
jgi:hypothetical protein